VRGSLDRKTYRGYIAGPFFSGIGVVEIMNRTNRHGIAWLTLASCLGLLTGCVDRRFVITTDPPGAIVYDEKSQPTGGSPADRQFTYYGKYRFTLIHDGYETMIVEENVRAPWYEWIGLDFFSEIVVPINLRDVRRFHYVMQPLQPVPAEAVLNQAKDMRAKGKSVGSPLPPKFPEPVQAPPPRVLPAPPPGTNLPQTGAPAPPQSATPMPPQLGAPLPR